MICQLIKFRRCDFSIGDIRPTRSQSFRSIEVSIYATVNNFVSLFESILRFIENRYQIFTAHELDLGGDLLRLLEFSTHRPSLLFLSEFIYRTQHEKQIIYLLLQIRRVQRHEAESSNNVAVIVEHRKPLRPS